jgi:hypothetical protein
MALQCNRWPDVAAANATLGDVRRASQGSRSTRDWAYAMVLLGAGLVLGCRPTTRAAPAAPQRPVLADPAQKPTAPAFAPDAARAAASDCDGGHISALAFVPTSSTLILGMDVGAAVLHPQYVSRRATFETGEFGRWVAAAGQCGLGYEHWRTLTLATDTATMNAPVMVVRIAEIGARDRLTCLRDRLTTAGKPPFEISDSPGPTELRFAEGSRAWVADRCTLVIASAGAIDGARARLDRPADSVLAGPMGNVVARAGEHNLLWIAMQPPATGLLVGGLLDAAVGIELRGGFSFNAIMQFSDPQAAAAAAGQVSGILSGGVGALGLPSRVLETKSVNTTDRFVSIQLRGDDGDLSAMIDALTKMVMGGA